jgi:hypothetical protein
MKVLHERGSMNRTNEEADILPPDQRRAEIARILAGGLRRLHARAGLPVVSSEQANLPRLGRPVAPTVG